MNKIEKRKEDLEKLYRSVLERAPDESGLNAYLYSDIPLDQIESAMRDSLEYADLKRAKNFNAQLDSLGSEELLVMGSSPHAPEHIDSLKSAGVQAVINLDLSPSYDPSWCDYYLHLPLDKDKAITVDKMEKILSFMYDNIICNRRRLFVHSTRGVERAPMILALFLVAEKKINFMDSVNIIISKQKLANPGISLISAELLEFVKNYKFKQVANSKQFSFSNPKVQQFSGLGYVQITEKLYVCKTMLPSTVLKIRELGVDVMVDINENKSKTDQSTEWFTHIHLPIPEKQIREMMPVVLRSVNKYSKRSKVIVVGGHLPTLIMFVENLVLNFKEEHVIEDMSVIRKKLASL